MCIRGADEAAISIEAEFFDESAPNIGLLNVVGEAGNVARYLVVGVHLAVVAGIVLAWPQQHNGPVVP